MEPHKKSSGFTVILMFLILGGAVYLYIFTDTFAPKETYVRNADTFISYAKEERKEFIKDGDRVHLEKAEEHFRSAIAQYEKAIAKEDGDAAFDSDIQSRIERIKIVELSSTY